MSFGGKADREWLEPLTNEGSRNLEDDELGPVMGCHSGAHEWLNVYGAKPGFTYVWERKKPNDIRKALMKGGQVVQEDDEEMTAARKAAGEMDFVTSVDSMAEYNELVLVRYPEAAIRKIREAEQKRADDLLKAGVDSFSDQVTAAEQSQEWNPRSVRTRFATSEHRHEMKAGGNTESQWTPNREDID